MAQLFPQMIVYTLISQQETILVDSAITNGNFASIAQVILQKIPPRDGQMSYVYDTYLFHYLQQSGIVYMCLSKQDFSRKSAFEYLQQVYDYYQQQQSKPIVEKQLQEWMNASGKLDKIQSLNQDLDHIRNIMVENIDKVLERGDRIDNLVDRTNDLFMASNEFRRTSTSVRRNMYWKNIKSNVILVVFLLMIMYLFVGIGCGFTLSCIRG